MSNQSREAVPLAAAPVQIGLDAVDEPRSFAPPAITDRQLQCLAWVQEGESATDIGVVLGLSGRTVENT